MTTTHPLGPATERTTFEQHGCLCNRCIVGHWSGIHHEWIDGWSVRSYTDGTYALRSRDAETVNSWPTIEHARYAARTGCEPPNPDRLSPHLGTAELSGRPLWLNPSPIVDKDMTS